MSGASPIEAATQAMREARSMAEVRGAMSAWAPQFHEAVAKPVKSRARPDLGIRMTAIPGPRGSGVTSKIGDSFFVSISKGPSPPEKRFALAHELGHVLLAAVDPGLRPDPGAAEDLCDLFARQAVAPPERVRDYIDRFGFPTDVSTAARFARHFRLSWRGAIVILGDFLPVRWPVAFVAASWRGHPRRQNVLGLRIEAATADRRLFLPGDCRLSTLGFGVLEDWVRSAELGEESSGKDRGVRLRSGMAGVSAWAGDSAWTARVHRAPLSKAAAEVRGAVCALDLSGLSPIHSRPRRAEPAPVARIAGQICLPAR